MINLNSNDIDKFNNSPDLKQRWQKMTDSLAKIIDVPVVLISKMIPPYIEVFCSNETGDNYYQEGDRIYLKDSCEQIIAEEEKLLSVNIEGNKNWIKNSTGSSELTSYLGIPLRWSNGEIFGTLWIINNSENNFNETHEQVISEFKELIENDLNIMGSDEFQSQEEDGAKECQYKEELDLISKRCLVENARDIIYTHDLRGNFKSINTTGVKKYKYSKEEFLELNINQIVDPEYLPIARENLQRKLQGEERTTPYELLTYTRTGEPFWVEVNSYLLKNEDGQPVEIQGIARDINRRKEVEKRVELQSTAMNSAIDGIAILNQKKGYIYLNKAHLKIYGYDNEEELLGKSWKALYEPEEIQRFEEEILPVFREKGEWRGEATGKRKDGSTFPQELSLTKVRDDNLICVVRDITERKKVEEEIKRLSFYDEVTELYNRFYFEEQLERLDTDRQLPLSLIIGDMNGLKLVNDAFGHAYGDRRLKKTAQILKNSCREEDIIARWGGDEFAIILPRTGSTAAAGICKRIERLCDEVGSEEIALSIALGTATKTKQEQDIQEIFDKAEDDMYRNKLKNSSRARSDIISSLKKSLLEKDYEAEEHAERLKNLALKFGQKLGLSSNTLDKLALLASLHDIGKVAIADEIINKNGSLSKEEWTEMKKHPEIGYRIAQASDELTPIAEGILAHHEWWDGTGYPQGLEKKKIPLIARIITIIDAYDIMIHGRPYKEAISHKEAVEELKRCAGTQFDPYLTEKFIDLLTYVDDLALGIN